MATLSLCMITLNEEKDLPQCLNAVKSIVDEIIIVDAQSSDKTKEIAKKYKAKVIDRAWNDDFAAARNESLKQATSDWILVLDADEVIAKSDLDKIKHLLTNENCDAYFLDQRNYTNDTKLFGWKPLDHYKECKGEGFFSNLLIRLFRNNKGIQFSNKIHEMVDKSLLDTKARVENSGIPIHHYGPLRSEEFLKEKREKYLRIGLEEIKRIPDNPRPYYEVALIYKKTQQWGKAKEYFDKVIELDPDYKLVHTNLGEVFARQGDEKNAVLSYREAIKRKPKNENAYINLSLIYVEHDKTNESVALLVKALKNNPKSATAHNNLALLLVKKRDFAKAVKILQTAFKRTGLQKFKKALDKLQKKQGDRIKEQEWYQSGEYDKLAKHFKSKLNKNKDDLLLATNLGMVYHKQEDYKKLASFLEDFLKDKKSKNPVIINMMVNLAHAYAELDEKDKATKVLKEAIALNPPKVEFLQERLKAL